MKAAAFLLLAFVAAFFVKGSVAEVGAGVLAAGPHLHRHLYEGAVNTGSKRTEPQGAKRRSLHQSTRVSGSALELSAKDIEGTWVGLSNPPVAHDRNNPTNPLLCPSEAKSRGACLDDIQITFEIDGDDFVYQSRSSSCRRCGSADVGERFSGTVTAFKNNRLEITYTDKDYSNDIGVTDILPPGRRDACINMEVFVEGGQVFAAARMQNSFEGTPEDVSRNLLNDGFSKCTPEPITCEIDMLSRSKHVLRFFFQIPMQCVSGKCLELAGSNGTEPTSLDPCDLNVPSSAAASATNASQSSLVALWAVTLMASILSYFLLQL